MRIGLKMAMVVALTLAILIPLSLVREVIAERQAWRAQAVADVERAFAGPQVVAGPVLTVPYSEMVEVEEADRAGLPIKVRRRVQRQWTFFPASLDVSGPLAPTTRRRGIHEVHLYVWNGSVRGRFDVAIPPAPAGAGRVVGEPWLGWSIADVRGIRGTPRLTVDGRELEPREGQGAREGSGLHVRLPAPAPGARLRLDTHLQIELGGAESLAVVPLGKRNRVALASTWPHPSFQGISPWRSSVAGRGFEAEWRVASVATDVQRQLSAGRSPLPLTPSRSARVEAAAAGGVDALGVVLADPVDTYTQADRATKYGLLFVLLTFVGFFMFEVIRALPIHPIQYALVGLALAIFFLLLVSLSEHLRFGIAYLIAGAACVGLIGFYVSAVLRSAARGAGFAAMLALLYAALYGLLVSEDNALVLGSGLLFLVLATIMTLTRRLDWYRAGAQFGAPRS
jgi:inner membrane protein